MKSMIKTAMIVVVVLVIVSHLAKQFTSLQKLVPYQPTP